MNRLFLILLVFVFCTTLFAQDSTKMAYRIYNGGQLLYEDSILVKKYLDGGNVKPFAEHYSYINSLNSIHIKGGDSLAMYLYYPLYCSRYYSFHNSAFDQGSSTYYFSEGGTVIRDGFSLSFSENDTIAYIFNPVGPTPLPFGVYGFKVIFDNPSNSVPAIQNNNISVYPNPSNGEFTIELTGFATNEELEYKLYDINGRLVFENKEFGSSKKKIILSDFDQGIFYLEITIQEKMYRQKLVFQQ